MVEYKSLVKKFSGKVSIEDIQEEFNRLVNAINDMVDTINDMNELQDQDFTKGTVKLASQNYTLTLGSLKQVLNLYDGVTIGGTCINENGYCKLFPSLYVSKDYGIKQIPESLLSPNTYATDLYFNPDTEQVGFPAGEVVEVVSGSENTYANLTNNNEFGSITSSANSPNAYKATGTGWTVDVGNGPSSVTWTWTFPKECTITSLGTIDFSPTVNWLTFTGQVKTLEGVVLYTLQDNTMTPGIPLPVKTRGLQITFNGTFIQGTIGFKSLSLKVKADELEIDPSTIIEQGIQDLTGFNKIAMLDWKRDGVKTLNTTNDDLLLIPKTIPILNMTPTHFTVDGSIPLDNSTKGAFWVPCTSFAGSGTTQYATIEGVVVNKVVGGGHRSNGWLWCYNPIWIPKDLSLSLTGGCNKALQYKMEFNKT